MFDLITALGAFYSMWDMIMYKILQWTFSYINNFLKTIYRVSTHKEKHLSHFPKDVPNISETFFVSTQSAIMNNHVQLPINTNCDCSCRAACCVAQWDAWMEEIQIDFLRSRRRRVMKPKLIICARRRPRGDDRGIVIGCNWCKRCFCSSNGFSWRDFRFDELRSADCGTLDDERRNVTCFT